MRPDTVSRWRGRSPLWVSEISGSEETYMGFVFESDYEVLPGTWTLTASTGSGDIYSVTFEVVDPRLIPEIVCDRSVPIS